MVLTSGSRLGPYEITALVGVGGMGEVYRARDTNLDREVAIKTLPGAFAQDPERLARFEREAKTLAALNHPNIAIIHGLERADPSTSSGQAGIRALVMELVEGPTLAERIAQGPIPVHEALPIARQIAEALEAAHEQGIIHRDLKPANIKLRPDGAVKVLDFGLAKALSPPEGEHHIQDGRSVRLQPDLTAAPTITSPAIMTGVGVLLGTAAYMSPEQAKGRAADKRSDVWAFGCVLYEMLTGRRCFDGEDVADTLALVLTKEPEWRALPPTTPPSINNLVRRCLEKDRWKRIGDVAAALFAIDEVGAPGPPARASSEAMAVRRVPLGQTVAIYSALVLLVGALAGGGVWLTARPEPPHVTRLSITLPSAMPLNIPPWDRPLTITPDGTRVVYGGANGGLFVRALDALEPTPLVPTSSVSLSSVSVSPDGQWVAYIEGNNTLKKLPMTGGSPVTIITTDGFSRGVTWGTDGSIFFATLGGTTGLQRIGASGGEPSVLTRPDVTRGEADHVWPEVLPDGRGLLFTIIPLAGGLAAAQVAVLDLATGKWTTLVQGGHHAHYLSSGHLVYAAGRTLRAVAFDVERRITSGVAGQVLPRLVTTAEGGADFAAARDGTIVYLDGATAEGQQRTVLWVDRQGRETPLGMPPRSFMHPRLSPDGTRVAATVFAEGQAGTWIWDLSRASLRLLTTEAGGGNAAIWTLDDRLVFNAFRQGRFGVFAQAANGSGRAERLSEESRIQWANGITADGRAVVLTDAAASGATDLWLLPLNGTRASPDDGVSDQRRLGLRALLERSSSERNGVVSPNGRWLAYEADGSGQFEIYAAPFPNVGDGEWLVSTGGGRQPLWAHSGRELFYLAPDGALMTVTVTPQGTRWMAAAPTKLLDGRYFTGGGVGGDPARHYDVALDDSRFLMMKEVVEAAPLQIVVVQHFDEELKRLVPVN